MRNGSATIPGSYGENSASHLSLATALWPQTMSPLAAGDAVELQGSFRAELHLLHPAFYEGSAGTSAGASRR